MTNQPEQEKWENIFDNFYDKNEAGGSSRWLVAPVPTVKVFIKGLLYSEKSASQKETTQRVLEMMEEIKPNKGEISSISFFNAFYLLAERIRKEFGIEV